MNGDMRILHIGNGNEKHRGQRSYDVGRKIQHGFIRNGHNSLFYSDRDMARAASWLNSSKSRSAIKAANTRLIETAENFKPEFLMLGHADTITAETIRTIRGMFPSAKVAQFNVDPMFMEGNLRNIDRKFAVVDATFVTTGGTILKKFSRPNHIAAFFPNPIDRAMETWRCHERTDLPYDIFYAVRATTTKADWTGNYRLDLPRQLRAAMPELKAHFHGFDGAPEIFGTAFYEALGSCRMGLNLSHIQTTVPPIRTATDEEKYLYSSDRIAQYLGCGLLTFSRNGNQLERLYGPDTLVYFDTTDELIEKVRYYRQHDDERQAIAARGWKVAHEQFNESLVAQYIVEATHGELSRDYAWPTETF